MTPHEKHRKRDMASAISACLADPPPVSIAEGWRARLIKSDRGKQLPVVANALVALRNAPEVEGVPAFDESSLNTIAKKRPPWIDRREVPFTWTDEDDIQ